MADKKRHPSIVPHGSNAHKALLGIDAAPTPEAKANLEAALVTPPVVSTKKPITPENYRARRRGQGGDPIMDDWYRVGR